MYMKFLSFEVALYLHEPTIWPCMQYFCYGAPNCYLATLDELQKLRHLRLLVLRLLLPLNPRFIIEI